MIYIAVSVLIVVPLIASFVFVWGLLKLQFKYRNEDILLSLKF